MDSRRAIRYFPRYDMQRFSKEAPGNGETVSDQMTPVVLLFAEATPKAAGWGTIAVIFGGIAIFMLVIRFLGLFLASTHPVSQPAAKPRHEAGAVLSVLSPDVDPKILAIIAATVSEVLQKPHRIVSLKKTRSVESLMQQWSLEGRRAIYSSHRFR